MERKRKRRLYHRPQTSGLSKRGVGNGMGPAVGPQGALRGGRTLLPTQRREWSLLPLPPSSIVATLFIFLHSWGAGAGLLLLSFKKGK